MEYSYFKPSDGLQIHNDPHQGKDVTDNEWTKE